MDFNKLTMALRLLEGEFPEGETVRVDAVGDELVFEPAGVGERAAALARQ